ncbi:metallophosphatase [Belliella sp. R4-6]|uniref:Metallophosphatase n=1 Tax=Belliella alkalica TaxID=1730871 RepID=A0ABS9VB59_9BACT|nr:metallophosphatase [Belliella alkalica]MCH7413666.1 metallophosphatase [Belliella alkalica]
MQRRSFLKKSILTGLGLSLGDSVMALSSLHPNSKSITIIHTNDMHSRIEPFPNDGGRNANQGGMTKLASLVKKVRSDSDNVLLLDSGDFFQGTPYFNLYGGELELKLMSQMGYDASTLGNHEFDNGLEGIKKQIEHANFNILSSNYEFTDTILKDAFLPYKIFNKSGIKIGVFALGISLDGLVGSKNYGKTKYLDPVAIAEEMVEELKRKKCNLIVCLSHLGYSYRSEKIDDLKLASQISGIDLILGGHTHTFLDEPTLVKNAEGHTTIVNQVGTGALRLGKLDFEFSNSNKITYTSSRNLTIY